VTYSFRSHCVPGGRLSL